jgi:hypothetical protein
MSKQLVADVLLSLKSGGEIRYSMLGLSYKMGQIRGTKKQSKNRKGRDLGYALAISSCEGANRVETCTITTLDAITAFAVPNPNCSSQNQSVFSGLDACRVASSS